MLRFIGFGLATGAGVQAWRNFPPDGPVSARPLALFFIVGVLAAYLGGLWRSRSGSYASATATAVAVSSAEATAHQTVNVALVVPGAGAGSTTGGASFPTESVGWFDGARVQLSEDDLDGADLSELGERSAEYEHG
jgi:hypothetical protein